MMLPLSPTCAASHMSMTSTAAHKWAFESALRRASRPTPSRTVTDASARSSAALGTLDPTERSRITPRRGSLWLHQHDALAPDSSVVDTW
jgi:hypothetical protein